MLKSLLAGGALATVLALGAHAQTATAPPEPAATTPMAPAMEAEAMMPVEFGTLSADDLIGAKITNPGGETIASVDDVVLTGDGKVEGVVAKFGGFLGFGSNTVQLMPDELQFFHDNDGNLMVQTALTPELLKSRPDYVKPAG